MAKKLKHLFIILVILQSASLKLKAQQWNGLTLYSNGSSTSAYLVDTNGLAVKTWSNLTGGTAYSCFLEPGGTLVRGVKVTNAVFNGGGAAGGMQKIDYNGNLIWDYTHSSSTYYTHHDHCVLPNGNVLMIAYELKTQSDLAAAGGTAALSTIWPEKIIEVQPTGLNTGNIVWEWHVWDHLVQNVDPAKANYQSSIVNHPELLNINYLSQKDWLHCNGLDYNPILDQIALSSHNMNEWYIIDHSTTTPEAASHSGGIAGKGGDFLYRWGNPAAYQASGTKILNVTHDVHWIPEGHPDAGRLVGFNNQGVSPSQSSIDQILPPINGINYTITPGSAYSPATYLQRTTGFGYTSNEGGSEQYPNGNQLVCVALAGKIYELNPAGVPIFTITTGAKCSQAHRYSNCYITNPAPPQPSIALNGNDLTTAAAVTYQWYYNGVLISGATSQNYTPTQNGVYVVRTTDANGCVYMYSKGFMFGTASGIDFYHSSLNSVEIFPNPSNGKFHITLNDNYSYKIKVCDVNGKEIVRTNYTNELNLNDMTDGVYFVTITNEVLGSTTKKIMLIK
ncbi:MAG: aryl-sulfate sulfotransferase [Sphingobacteriaceae bacterium]